MATHRRIVVTGGPGAGKTALLQALAARGHVHVPETARAIILDRKQHGLSPRPDPEQFARDILRADIERYRSTPVDGGAVFFDRGIPDALCMLDQLGLLTPEDARRTSSDHPCTTRCARGTCAAGTSWLSFLRRRWTSAASSCCGTSGSSNE